MNMKTMLKGLECAVLAALAMGFALGAQAASGDSIIATKGEENMPFEDLASAFAWIGENTTGTVMVGANLDLGPGGAAIVPNGSDITLELCGARIDWTTTNGDALIFFPENTNGKLTINAEPGGTISSCCDSSEVTNSALIVYCKGNGDLTVNGGTFICSNKVGAATHFFKSGNGDWTFNGGTYMACGEGAGGAQFLYCTDATGTTHVAGGTYDIRATAGAAAGIGSNAECFEKILITGGDFDVVTAHTWAGAFSCGNGSMVVDGGDFTVTSSVEGVYCILAERNGTTILSNGTFRAETSAGYAYAAGSIEQAKLTIAGGTYYSKAFKDTAATVVGKEQSTLTLVGAPVINNGATDGTAWNLAIQLWGSHFDFTDYTGANLPSFAVFADGTYGASYVKGDMSKFNGASIFAGYFSTRPNDWNVLEGNLPLVNVDAATKTAYPWVIGKGAAEAGSTRGNYYASFTNAWQAAANEEWSKQTNVFVRLLADVTVDAPLVHVHGKDLTLDLNDKVLAYGGANNGCVLKQEGGTAMHIVDTSTNRTARYFTCDESGLWTRADHETELAVRGGLITGGRASAVSSIYGGVSISNVNFVGNSSATSGGAVLVSKGSLSVAESAFFGNVSAQHGGAIYAAVPCEMSNCRVEANVATNFGGGAYMKTHGSLVRTSVVGNKAGSGGGVYLTFAPSCFPAGVKILMADGSEKNVEEVVKGDVVATFDHVGGTNSSAAVFSIYRGTGQAATFRLSFASGATLDIADCHDLLFETTRKYVTVSSDNTRQFVGRRFYNYATGGWDELTGVTEAKGSDAHYSLYTRGHGNCVANGILTVPDDKDCFVNIYELDENLKADAAQLAADVVTYGLATTADYPNVPPDEFAAHNMRYARIAIGKGLTTQERILFWNEFDYGPIVEKKVAPASKLMMSAVPTPPMTGSGVVIPAPSDPYLQVGEGTVVTGNVTTAGGTSNVYLKPDMGKTPVVDILPDTANLNVGVTLSTGTGLFGWTNNVNYASGFFSDDPQYAVFYTADKVLELAVPPHKHCICGDGACSAAGHSHAEIVWEPWASTTSLPDTAGNWYLVNDVTVDSKWEPADGTRLCLNGRTVTSTMEGCAIAVETGISFLITDCNSVPGSVLHADASGVGTYGVNVVGDEREGEPTGFFTAYRIALANHPAGGVFSGPHAFAALYDVAVTNNDTQGLLVSRASTNFVFGGMIAGNHGYGVKADTATVVIEGARITGNASESDGGGINCQGSEMTLRDVTVIGNQAATHGGGVYVAPRQTGKFPWDVKQSVVTLDGATVITNNVVGEGSADNLYLEGDDSLVSLAADHGDLDVGVTLSSGTGRFTTTDNVTQSDAVLFTSDNAEYAVRFDATGTFLKLGYAGIQVGDDAWAQVADGLCTVVGTGDMWSHDNPSNSPLWSLKGAITRVLVGDSVTGIGKNDFSYMGALKDVEIGNSVTQVAAKAFYRCTYATNLVVGAGVTTVGAAAFERCYSLETFRFGSKAVAEACQNAYKIVARITMDGETPVVDAVPEVTIDGWNRELQGKTNLTDAVWIPIDETKPIPYGFHFFKYEYVAE